jgi:F-type H+-transporting ATPase subunit b
MLIDWFTVCAQIVNFLVLVWLLKRFLFGRIVRAIETRESTIASRLAEAAEKERQAAERLALYQAKLEEFEQQRESLLAAARTAAEAERDRMLQKTREELRAMEAKWREEMERGRLDFLAGLRRRAGAEILAVTRRTVAGLACQDVQECVVSAFLEKIRRLDEEAWKGFSGGELAVRTAADLPPELQAEIRRTLEERAAAPVRVRFETSAEIGLGLELRGNGYRVGWNSESYLRALEEDVEKALARIGEGDDFTERP